MIGKGESPFAMVWTDTIKGSQDVEPELGAIKDTLGQEPNVTCEVDGQPYYTFNIVDEA